MFTQRVCLLTSRFAMHIFAPIPFTFLPKHCSAVWAESGSPYRLWLPWYVHCVSGCYQFRTLPCYVCREPALNHPTREVCLPLCLTLLSIWSSHYSFTQSRNSPKSSPNAELSSQMNSFGSNGHETKVKWCYWSQITDKQGRVWVSVLLGLWLLFLEWCSSSDVWEEEVLLETCREQNGSLKSMVCVCVCVWWYVFYKHSSIHSNNWGSALKTEAYELWKGPPLVNCNHDRHTLRTTT